MAVVTTKSAEISNRDATPAVFNSSGLTGGHLRSAYGSVAIASGDSVGSKYIVASVPSNAVIRHAFVTAPDIGTTTAADVGLYKTTKDGGAAVSSQFFKAGVVLNAGAITNSDIVNGNVITLANAEKRVWEQLGLSSDPSLMYDVVLTLSGAADGAGNVVVEVQYTM